MRFTSMAIKDRNGSLNASSFSKMNKFSSTVGINRSNLFEEGEGSPKTHFKALQSFSLSIPDSLTKLKPTELPLIRRPNQGKSEGRADPADMESGENKVLNRTDDRSMDPRGARGEDEDSFTGDVTRKSTKLPSLGAATQQVIMGSDQFNPFDSSKNVLQRCNVVRPKNRNVSVLHPGEGHLTSMPDLRVRDVYQRVFPRDDGKPLLFYK
eukprot:TRINITY_DN4675_c0_g1_i9.p1 TRINITY_DN4675_c0_g1~~TRINITY_DN4675_c0_g1_i9.p1  ORF type:complete len:210 (-),score=29.96 TRINITY_DN4675_c0_g1_i9:105-734(-)